MTHRTNGGRPGQKNEACFNCGLQGQKAIYCRKTNNKVVAAIENGNQEKREKSQCYNCRRFGHFAEYCWFPTQNSLNPQALTN